MKTMMLSDFLAVEKSLRKNVMLWALLAIGTLMFAIFAWIYQFRLIDFGASLPLVGMVATTTQTLGGSLLVAACMVAAACALYLISERAAVRGYRLRDL